MAYTNPDSLLKYDLVDSTCIYYRNALIAGGSTMIEAWVQLNEEQKSENGDPENVQKEFDAKYFSPQYLDYARIDLMIFGWWNHANHLLPHINPSYDYSKEFERLLIDHECECDEP